MYKVESKKHSKINNYSKEYGEWLGTMDWNFMITIRKNYKTTPNMVRNIANKLFKEISDVDKLTYVGERDEVDKNNYHIHILINSSDLMKVQNQLEKHSKRVNKYDTFYIEPIRNKCDAANYITKHFNWSRRIGDDIVWDLLIK